MRRHLAHIQQLHSIQTMHDALRCEISNKPQDTIHLRAATAQHQGIDSICTLLQASKNLAILEGNSKVSGALYMAGEEHLKLLLDTYSLFSHTNPLHTEVWPSMRQMESDVIAMTAAMLGGTALWPRMNLF